MKIGNLWLYEKDYGFGLVIAGIAALLSTGGCRRHSAQWRMMDAADSLMEEHPDSALAILENYNPEKNASDYEKSLYGLLLRRDPDRN